MPSFRLWNHVAIQIGRREEIEERERDVRTCDVIADDEWNQHDESNDTRIRCIDVSERRLGQGSEAPLSR